MVSNVTGQLATTEQLTDPDYWVRHILAPVHYADGITHLHDQHGVRTFVELGPDATLTALHRQTLADAVAVPALHRKRPYQHTLLAAAGTVGGRPAGVDNHLDLPTYPFQHTRHWLVTAAAARPADLGLRPSTHPLLGGRLDLATDARTILTGRLSLATHPWLVDHTIADRCLLPATALVDMVLHAGAAGGHPYLDELTLHSPLVLPADGAVEVQVVVAEPTDGHRTVAVHSRPAGETDTAWTMNAAGRLTTTATAGAAEWPAPWPPAGASPVEVAGLYDELAGLGYRYGPAFQGLRRAWRAGDDLYAEVTLPEGVRVGVDRFGVHPALLDAALHVLGVTDDVRDGVWLPFVWSGVRLHATGATSLRVRLSRPAPDRAELAVYDPAGQPVLAARSLVLREIPRQATGPAATRLDPQWLLHLDWPVLAGVEVATDAAGEPIFAAIGVDEAAADLLRRALPAVRVADSPEAACAIGAKAVVVPCWTAGDDEPDADVLGATHRLTESLLLRLREWLAEDARAETRLVVLTRGAVSTGVDDRISDLAGAACWGLVRSSQTEHPDRITIVDLDPAAPDDLAGLLSRAVGCGEPQVAIRDGRLHVPRLAPAHTSAGLPLPNEDTWRLETTSGGSLDNLRLTHCPDYAAPLQPHQVRVRLHAGGVNFRDVVVALGIVNDPRPIGGEGAGTITDIGTAVTDLHIGQQVMGLFNGIGPTAVTDHRLVTPIPDGWTLTQAATAPIAYLTAHYALHDLAHLQPGEHLLIHAATGGVGQAAIHYARHLGAHIHTTAHPTKWPTLHRLGITHPHLANSRTLDFEDHYRTHTPGIDIVLNSLTGEHLDASGRLLTPGGRLIDMGKTDIRDPHTWATNHPHTTYQAFDLMDAGENHIAASYQHLSRLFQDGTLPPLPTRSYDIRHSPQAFRYLANARHTGKIALTLPPPAAVTPREPTAAATRRGTTLITGGTGTLAQHVAAHLITHHDVHHLHLLSRQGPHHPDTTHLVHQLTGLGATITITRCNTTDKDQLTAVIDHIDQTGHPLTSVIHTAGTLRDTTLTNLTPPDLHTTLNPKIDTAWHLHNATRNRPLTHFVLFSSSSGTIDTPGQGNYAAANAFLDALAQHRRDLGLVATSTAWGYWTQRTGMTGHLTEVDRARMARAGSLGLATEEGLALLDAALTHTHPTLAPVKLHLPTLRNQPRVPAIL
ncbi:SDR family NAD(P)-dependent oxidoreductase, partial [Micromonospora yasonensis]|uniref:SDR family NAD(P)-dependent oxidoreductase n=1 Tax=Micromonospora yasonensis TaxID=1128667 RepID=UPI0022313E3D